MKFTDRLIHAWNAFTLTQPQSKESYNFQNPTVMSSSSRMDRTPLRIGTERSIIASIYNRIAIDVASIEIRHARVDEDRRFQGEIKSNLNECLAVSANKDQTSRAFLMDVVLSMFDEGVVAIVPIDTNFDIMKSNTYDIFSMRVGRITQWMPDHVRVNVYNDNTGHREEITLPKSKVCIIENPLYQVMNEPNSTLQRLKHKLALMDATDDKQNSDKLNMIIQLPYAIKGESKMQQAEKRRKEVELQLTDSKYGVAYIDGTEKIIQLGHPLENRLIEQIEYFTNQLYAQLGLTPGVFDGTADEHQMLNYNNRTLEPIVSAIVDEMNRKFLTKTARTQGQAIMFFKDPFSLITVSSLGELVDSFTRNEIFSSNDFRAILGYKPGDTDRADQLLNKNINPADAQNMMPVDIPETNAPGTEEIPAGIDQNDNPDANAVLDIDNMSKDELESYLQKLEAYNNELDELTKQVNGK